MTNATTNTATEAIERQLELSAGIDRVWRALTDETELGSWFGERASFRPEPGADGWLEWDAQGRFAVRVVDVEPERRISWRGAREADTAIDDGPSTLVEWTLEPRGGGGTVLHMRESGFERLEDRRGNVHGWVVELGELLEHLAGEPWEAGIRRTYSYRSSPERVWRAFSDSTEFKVWWGGTEPIEIREGFEGWFAWPSEGRFAMRIDHVEPPTYVAWRWAIQPDVDLESAAEVLRTEWVLEPRPDGGTDVHLLESGFRGPKHHGLNSGGWDSDVEPGLRRHLGEATEPT